MEWNWNDQMELKDITEWQNQNGAQETDMKWKSGIKNMDWQEPDWTTNGRRRNKDGNTIWPEPEHSDNAVPAAASDRLISLKIHDSTNTLILVLYTTCPMVLAIMIFRSEFS